VGANLVGKVAVAAAAVAVAAGGVLVATQLGAGGGGNAPHLLNLPPSVYQRFMSTTGTDSGTCSTALTACLSFWYTYQQASPGDNVSVATGTYTTASLASGTDILRYDATKVGGSTVTFWGQGSAHATQVNLGGTTSVSGGGDILGAQNVTFDNVDFLDGSPAVIPQNGSSCGVNANGVTFQNLYINGAFNIRNAQNLTLTNVDIGNYSLPDGGTQDAWGDSSRIGDYTCTQNAANIVLNGVRWHNIYRGDSSDHAECIFVEAVTNVTIENSKFEGCPIIGIFLKNDGGTAGTANYQNNVTIENNFFTQPCPDYTAAAGAGVPIGGGVNNSNQTDCSNEAIQEADCNNDGGNGVPATPMTWVIRFNSISPNARIWICEDQTNAWSTSSKLYGNIASDLLGGHASPVGCASSTAPANMVNWHVAYNVWIATSSPVACSATDQTSTAAAEYQNPGGVITYNYHLIAGTGPKAHALVPVSEGCPATDIDGDAYPGSGFCDAGADEASGGGGGTTTCKRNLNSDVGTCSHNLAAGVPERTYADG
jgi:hypothetical protein